jgi:hypothetical protein
MENDVEDITLSRDLIKQCTPEQWSGFQDAIKMIELVDLANIADRLGSGQKDSWQDYCDSFGDFEWYQFCEAYQHCLDRPFSPVA